MIPRRCLAAISSIINRYPGHKFILIGDSGECDPEIYGEIYRKFPGKIDRIMVRKVTGSDFADGRMAEALNGVPKNDWELIGGDAVAGDKTCQDAYRRE